MSLNPSTAEVPKPTRVGKPEVSRPTHAPSGSLSPESLRAQAAECGRLANIASAQRDHAEVGRLINRARELCLLAPEAEAEART